jgi:hypothetical protein
MQSFTIFSSIFDNTTQKKKEFKSWESFESFLYKISEIPGYKPKKGEYIDKKIATPLFSPAIYNENTTRANANVIKWAKWAALDVDDYEGSADDAIAPFKNYYYVCYSSASSTKEHPRFRLVFPLQFDVKTENIRHFWYALNTEFNSVGDHQCKDLSRMYYVPAKYKGAFNFIFTNKGDIINPQEMMQKHDYVETFKSSFGSNFSEKIKAKMKEYRETKLINDDISWSSYEDCPFVYKKWLVEYQVISETGWYAAMYKIMSGIANSAIKAGYPITPTEIAILCEEIDSATGSIQKTRYGNRPYEVEAARAIDYVLSS